jgi:hypothetical protein
MSVSQADAIRLLLRGFREGNIADELMRYVRALEDSFAESMDIEAFIMGVRCFFSWHGIEGFDKKPKEHERVQAAWYTQNEGVYTKWLESGQDDTKQLMWAKWTFQAKTSIFEEWLHIRNTVPSQKRST